MAKRSEHRPRPQRKKDGTLPEGAARYHHAILTLVREMCGLDPDGPLSPGSEMGKLFVIDSRLWRELGAVGDRDRTKAAELLAERHARNPVHHSRRTRVRSALREEAERPAHSGSVAKEMRGRTAAALHLAEPGTLLGMTQKELRAALNRAVTEDALGPGWRHTKDEVGLEQAEAGDLASDALAAERRLETEQLVEEARERASAQAALVEVRADVERLVARAHLSPGEAAVVTAVLMDEESIEGYAARRGVKASAARAQKSRALVKLRRAAGV